MKQLFVYFILCLCISFSIAQSSVRSITSNTNATQVLNKGWDLNQHVWSHTHSLPHKKPLLDFEAMDNWIHLSDDKHLSISPDGKYVAFGIQRGVDPLAQRLDSVVVQATHNSWRMPLAGVKPGFFSADSKLYIYERLQGLSFLQVETNKMQDIQDVASYKLPNSSKKEWLACQLKNKKLVLRNLVTGTIKNFDSVATFEFDKSGKWLLCRSINKPKELLIYNLHLQQECQLEWVKDYKLDDEGKAMVLQVVEKDGNTTTTSLQYLDYRDGERNQEIKAKIKKEIKKVWSSSDPFIHVSSISLDRQGQQVVFAVSNDEKAVKGQPGQMEVPPENSVWYWRKGMEAAEMKINYQTQGIDSGVFIQAEASFTDSGNYILFRLQDRPELIQPINHDLVKLNIWDYRDKGLQSATFIEQKSGIYLTAFNLSSGKVVQVLRKHENLKALSGSFAVVAISGQKKYGDRYWEKGYLRDSNWLVNLQNGSRRLLPTAYGQYNSIWFSPGEKYLVFFDPEKGCNYFSYNLATGELANISTSVPAWYLGTQNRGFYSGHCAWSKPEYLVGGGLAGWLENEEGILVYDDFDLWKLDLSGKKRAINMTNGRLQGIKFGLMEVARGKANDRILPKQLMLTAFNTKNKNNGYYQLSFDAVPNSKLLYMDAAIIQGMDGVVQWDRGMQPLKAADTVTWIVRRQTAMEPSNYFVTHDFKKFSRLTNIQTQRQYNWFTKELHSYRDLKGVITQGLLYKPENFDPLKKYPVIIIFYNQMTGDLNRFSYPKYNETAIAFGNSPAWLVSHGYLVFTPDIYVTAFKYGPSAFNIVEGAARYLKKMPFVDGDHIGACAHSLSAKLGTYVFTHSSSFAAMAISEGFAFANPISLALSIDDEMEGSMDKSLLRDLEYGFEYGNLWEHKTSWLDQTAVLNIDKANCPLLLFGGMRDAKSRINQTFQLFISLRRLEKKAWWLQYNNVRHIAFSYEARDFTIRFTQYFDHFLKGAPPPAWMTKGLPANERGKESRYELDLEGSCGKNCAVCDIAHKKKSTPSNKIVRNHQVTSFK
jgi:WD40 repeat protein